MTHLHTRPENVWVDGRLEPADDPHLLVTDRGFQLGDGLFETLRARRGVLIEWPDHVARLREGAAILEIATPDLDELEGGIRELLHVEHLSGPGNDRFAPGDAAVRITISRGSLERRGTLPAGWRDVRPTVVVQVWPYVPPPARQLEEGLTAIVSAVRRDPLSPLAGVKATSRADYVAAKLEAERAGVDDALFPTIDGRISEATSANVFALIGDRLVTPGRSSAVLVGTTRSWLLESGAAARLGLQACEDDLTLDDLASATEALLCSSVAGIVPLVEIDGSPDRRRSARRPDPRPARRARALDRRGIARRERIAVTRGEVITRTRQLIAEGERLDRRPVDGWAATVAPAVR